jgi:hypothetical protein
MILETLNSGGDPALILTLNAVFSVQNPIAEAGALFPGNRLPATSRVTDRWSPVEGALF